ncbi:YdcF family protein [Vibrio sp.]|nr:YdcF family protein [Vibrio sp.]
MLNYPVPKYIRLVLSAATFLIKHKLYAFLSIILGVLFVIFVDLWITYDAQDRLVTIDTVPSYDVALVLGTSKYIRKDINPFYTHRMDAAIALYNEGKVQQFLLSGDNAHRSYNEPKFMRKDLRKAGISPLRIHMDFAGFRTLDSIVRTKEIFGLNRILIITQQFHCERALFIAKHYGISAQCFPVEGANSWTADLKIRLRETLARTNALIDLFILKTQPKFLGDKHPIIPIPEQPETDTSKTESKAELLIIP